MHWIWRFALLLLFVHATHAEPLVFSSGVNFKFPRLKPLLGWKNTSQIIELTLQEWNNGALQKGPTVSNVSPADWEKFLSELPAGSASRPSIVYLASHQTPAAEWEFPNGQQISWSMLLRNSGRKSAPPTLVIVDACFGSSVLEFEEWKRFSPNAVFASDRFEREYELRFDRSRPFDAPRRMPEVKKWLEAKLGNSWDGRISFFGAIWAETVLGLKKPPKTDAEWQDFLKLLGQNSTKFRDTQSKKLASTILTRSLK